MIKILHLYHDLLNLYGESGNVLAIKYHFEQNKTNTQVIEKSINDKLDLKEYDIIYIGGGTENNQKLALKHLINYKEDIQNFIKENKLLISTGNSIDLFGRYIETLSGKKYQGLAIFNFYSKEIENRKVKEISSNIEELNLNINAFLNSGTDIKGIKKNLIENAVFIKKKNFYATNLIGPILARNDNLLKHIIKNIG